MEQKKDSQERRSIGEQGISNRLAEEEHAFPESDDPPSGV
jgi:hypothetical protein